MTNQPMYPHVQRLTFETGDPGLHHRNIREEFRNYRYIDDPFVGHRPRNRQPYPYIDVHLNILNPILLTENTKTTNIPEAMENAHDLTLAAISKMFVNPMLYDRRKNLDNHIATLLGVKFPPQPRKDPPVANMLQCDNCKTTARADESPSNWKKVESLGPHHYYMPSPKFFCSSQCQFNHILKHSDQAIVVDPKELRSEPC